MPSLLIKVIGMSLFLWGHFAIAIKRLHDRDKSGWCIVLFCILPAGHPVFRPPPEIPIASMVPLPTICFGLYVGDSSRFFPEGLAKDQGFGRPSPFAASAAWR